jgi:LPS sulfotransferase NodH
MALYEDQFSKKHNFRRVEAPSKILIIASTPRCGSHMLGHALHETGCFGFPLEYTTPKNLVEWRRRLGAKNLQDVISKLQECRTSPNGVFGIKIHYSDIKEYGGFAKMVSLFPNAYYILLSREDVLKQAVSLSIARQTGVWIAGQDATSNTLKYSYNKIELCLKQTIIDNASWRYKFEASGCSYVEMNFDLVRNDLIGSIQQIAKFVGIKVKQEKLPTVQVTKKQSSDINEEWARRFKAEFNMSDELITTSCLSYKSKVKKAVKKIIF